MSSPRESFPPTPGNPSVGGAYGDGGNRTRAIFPAQSQLHGHEFELVIEGRPVGWQRARVDTRGARPRHYNDPTTELGESAVRGAWTAAGQPTLSGPLGMDVEAVFRRPETHWKTDGTLSVAGERNPWPAKKPDWDNVGKLIADSLNDRAYRDDAQIVCGNVIKRWANPGEHEHTRIRVRTMPTLAVPGARRAAA